MSKRFKFVLVAFAVFMLVFASMACEEPQPPAIPNIPTDTPAPVYKYAIKVPGAGGLFSSDDIYRCNAYRWLESGDLELTDCRGTAHVVILNPPKGISIVETD